MQFGKDIGIELAGHIIIAGTKARAFYLAPPAAEPAKLNMSLFRQLAERYDLPEVLQRSYANSRILSGKRIRGFLDDYGDKLTEDERRAVKANLDIAEGVVMTLPREKTSQRGDIGIFDIPPASRKFAIPLMERMVRKSTSGPQEALSSPSSVRDFIRKLAPSQDGLLWLDAQHRVQGWQPMTLEEMGKMRTGDIRTGAAELFRRIGRNNPAAAIAVVHDAEGEGAMDRVGVALRTLKAMLAQMDVQVLDGFIVSGPTTVSLAERGVMQDTPKYSVAPQAGPTGKLSVGQVQDALDRIAEQWQNAPVMRAVQTEEELPDRVRTQAAAEGMTGRVQAVIDPVSGMMYMVAPQMGSTAQIQFVVMHEVMGHYGLRGAFGPDLDAALQYLWTNNPRVRAKTAEASQRWGYSLEDRRLDAIEEAVSELAAEGYKFNGIRQFFATVQTWLRAHGMGELADWLEGLTDAELTSVLTMSRAYVVDGGMHFSGDAAMSAIGPVWYSGLRRHIDVMPTNNATSEHWKRELESAIKTGKMKRDELEWSGLSEWLDVQTGKIAKGDVVDFLGQNGVQVTETVLGGTGGDVTSDIDSLVVQLDALGYSIESEPNMLGKSEPVMLKRRSDGQEFNITRDASKMSELPDVLSAMDLPIQIRTLADRLNEAVGRSTERDVSDTRYSSYTLPGGKNYRELLLTLPAFADENVEKYRVFDAKGNLEAENIVGRERAERILLRDALGGRIEAYSGTLRSEQNFRSGHFDQPNILAHIRFNERTDAEGKRVLFIEEVQSDWGERGRKEGFSDIESSRARVKEIQKRLDEIQNAFDAKVRPPLETRMSLSEENKALTTEWADLQHRIENSSNVPAAPFIGKTESWVALSMKHMIRYAAENDFDRVAWTTGEQQTERYDLSKQVDTVTAKKWGDVGKIGITIRRRMTEGRGSDVLGEFEPSKLPDVVGKDLAEKIQRDLKDAPDGTVKQYAGLDLKVGGEGMRAFYDKIVPNVANDVLKKLGGGRVGEISVPTEDRNTAFHAAYPEAGLMKQPGFDIIPALRESVMRGVPLFAVAQGDRPITPGARRYSTYSEDNAGRPLLAGEVVQIAEPEFYRDGPEGTKVYNHKILAGNRIVGVAMLGWKDGAVHDLYYIATFPKLQKLGIAEDVVRAILNHNNGIPLRAVLVLAPARGFWSKMGAQFQDTAEGEDGLLTLNRYFEQKRAREATGGARPGAAEGIRQAAVGEGEAGPAAAPGAEAVRFSVADPAISDQERADALLAQRTASIRPLETLFKGATELVRIPKLTGFIYDKLVSAVQNVLPESVKAGLIDKYGVPEYVQDRFAETIGRERQQLRETANLLDRMPLTREEARVAYQWLNQNAAGGDEMLNGVSLDSKETLRGWKEWAHQMQGEAVRLGQLDADTAERNEYAYTHRSYLKYETGRADQKGGKMGSVRILGDQYRHRGLNDPITTDDLAKWNPQWWERVLGKEDIGLKGKMFLKLEKRVGSKEGMAVLPGIEETTERGKVTRRVYWPVEEPVPARYADYELESTWEARWLDGRKVTMYRDFTAEERKAMGEIDDARYAVAKTSQLMIHDLEVGRLLEWLANHEARPEAPRDAEVVEANESLRKAYRPGTWVKVPESNAPGTKVARYGKLAGLYIPGPIWNEIRQVVGLRYKPLGETYDQLLRLWKVFKTAYSPAVHMNNIMADVVMAEWQDLTAAHIAKAVRVISKPDDPANKIILGRFEDAGGSVGMWTLSEIQTSQLEPLLSQLEREAASDNPEALVNAASVIQALQAGRYREAADMVERSGPMRASKAVLDKMIEIYQGEDQLFRLAAFLKAKEEGQSDTAAGKFARTSFLDYHITAPWINVMRSTAFPFVAFTYRALPLLAEVMAKKPWKMFKLAALAGALDALGYALSGGDEDRERKLLPEEKSGQIWGYSGRLPFTQMEVDLGVTPKLIRMPWNDQFGSPVFLDIRRFVPLGDIVDVGQVHSAIPLLPTMMPGGPLALVAELVANRSFFTGKEIVKETDTDFERTKKLAQYVYQWAIPNIPLVPGAYSFLSIKGAAAGEADIFGRERSVAQAAASAVGVRLASYPEDLGRQQILRQLGGEKREIGENVSALRRQFQRGALDRDEFESKIREQLEKRQQFQEQARRRLSAG